MDRLGRRHFVQGVGVAGLGLVAGCGRLPWQAHQPAKTAHVGWLYPNSAAVSPQNLAWFQQALSEYGWIDGQDLVIDARYAEGRDERLPTLAAELVQQPVDVLVTVSTLATLAARDATASIPIVFATGADPVVKGLADGYPRPGGNVTGITVLTAALSAKRLELLKVAAPGASQVAVFWKQPDTDALQETQRAAQVLGVE